MLVSSSSFLRYSFAFVILILFAVVSVVAPGSTQSTCEATSGTLERITYPSAILGQTMFASVYTPPCYAQDAGDVPLLVLLHGSNEDDGHWPRLGLVETLDAGISAGRWPPMVVALPFGNVIANRNTFDGVSWDRIFNEEFMPHIEANYRVSATRAERAIGGISRGGFWAYHLALRAPESFARVGGHSAFFDQNHAAPPYNPLDLIESVPQADTLHLWLDRGAEDYAAPGLDLMHERMTARGLDHDYIIHPQGQHNNAYWSQHVAAYLDFYAAEWSAEAATPTPEPTQDFPPPGDDLREKASADARLVFLPTVAFPSLLTSIDGERLLAIFRGHYDPALVLAEEMIAPLFRQGFIINAQTRILPENELRDWLWRRRDAYTLLPFDALTLRDRVLWVDDVHPLDQLESYPFAFESAQPNYDPARLTRITVTGVTALARRTREALDANGLTWATEAIRDYARRADILHLSSETPVYDPCPDRTAPLLGGLSFCTKPEHLAVFEMIGADLIELSGNHNNDYGYEAYRDTLNRLHAAGLATVGGGDNLNEARQPFTRVDASGSLAWIACNAAGPYYAWVNEDPNLLGGVRPGAARCDWDWLQDALPPLAQAHDLLIVTVQHVEFDDRYVPTPQQRADFRRLADLGADVVIGTAPHKPGIVEFYAADDGDTAFLHYGLGNFFFDQPWWGNRRVFLDTLYLYEGRLLTVELFPGIIDDEARPRLMTPNERRDFLHFMFIQQNGF